MSETEKCGASIPMGPGISAQCGLPLLHAGTHRDVIPQPPAPRPAPQAKP